MISGKKLKKIRQFRKLTQKDLAIMSGLTDVAILNYELGNRSPNIEQLKKIATALNFDISALINHEPNSVYEVMQIILDYEKELKFRPLVGDGETTSLLSNDPTFNDFLIEWDEMRKKHYNDEITDEEFEDWKLSYPKKSRFLKKVNIKNTVTNKLRSKFFYSLVKQLETI